MPTGAAAVVIALAFDGRFAVLEAGLSGVCGIVAASHRSKTSSDENETETEDVLERAHVSWCSFRERWMEVGGMGLLDPGPFFMCFDNHLKKAEVIFFLGKTVGCT